MYTVAVDWAELTELLSGDVIEFDESSGSGDTPKNSQKYLENDTSGERRKTGRSVESDEVEYKRNYIPRDEEAPEDDEDDGIDSALEANSNSENASNDEEEGSTEEQTLATRGRVITDTMDDIAQAALENNIERKSDVIHSLPTNNNDEAPITENQKLAAPEDSNGKQRNGAALKNLFSALANTDTDSAGSGAEPKIYNKEAKDNHSDEQVSTVKRFASS